MSTTESNAAVRVTARNRGSNRCRDRVLFEGDSVTGLGHSAAGPAQFPWPEHFSLSFYGDEQMVRVVLSAEQAQRVADFINEHAKRTATTGGPR